MWVSPMTSTDLATTNCGSDNDGPAVSLNQQKLSHRQCRRSRSTKGKAKTMSMSTMQHNHHQFNNGTGLQIVLKMVVYVFAAFVLLNTFEINSAARADTVQYPVTAPFGSGLIPPGKRNIYT